LIHYQGVYMGDDTPKVAKILIRDDDGGLPSCPDPFAPQVIAPRDGGPSGNAEVTREDTQPTEDTLGVPPLQDAGTPDATIPFSPDGGIVPDTSDADTISGSKLNSSGCALNSHAGTSGRAILVVALGLALAIRRRRSN
jgi:MYXO-CTERM domain-containing protein